MCACTCMRVCIGICVVINTAFDVRVYAYAYMRPYKGICTFIVISCGACVCTFSNMCSCMGIYVHISSASCVCVRTYICARKCMD